MSAALRMHRLHWILRPKIHASWRNSTNKCGHDLLDQISFRWRFVARLSDISYARHWFEEARQIRSQNFFGVLGFLLCLHPCPHPSSSHQPEAEEPMPVSPTAFWMKTRCHGSNDTWRSVDMQEVM